MIHVFIGTKAQYIKTAPLLRLMDREGVSYRLIDSGQHASLSRRLRRELRVRTPDRFLARGEDVESIPAAALWALRLAARLVRRRRLRRDVFGGRGGVCVVHGDTPSTLLAILMARRAGLHVAHIEAGLRSGDLLHPFPEELIRVASMHLAQDLFAPHGEALENLRVMGLGDRAVALPANTTVEAVRYALEQEQVGGRERMGGAGEAVVVTMHRVENLTRRGRMEGLLDTVSRIAESREVLFVLHGPTRRRLESTGMLDRLERLDVEVAPLLPYAEFVQRIERAPFVITDGGSIQEECAILGVPTLLWRKRTERPEGLGENVVLSRYDPEVVRGFLEEPDRFRRPPSARDAEPSRVILERLLARERS